MLSDREAGKRQEIIDAELLLKKFDNAEHLLSESPLFAKTFYSLCQGADVHKLLEQIIVMVDNYQKQMKEIIENQGAPSVVIELNENNLDLILKEAFMSDSDFPDW